MSTVKALSPEVNEQTWMPEASLPDVAIGGRRRHHYAAQWVKLCIEPPDSCLHTDLSLFKIENALNTVPPKGDSNPV